MKVLKVNAFRRTLLSILRKGLSRKYRGYVKHRILAHWPRGETLPRRDSGTTNQPTVRGEYLATNRYESNGEH